MNRRLNIALSALLSLVGTTGHAANKCVNAEGEVTFQDAPCPKTSKSSEALRLRENTVGNGVGRPAPPEKLVFGEVRAKNLVLAAAALDLLATNGRDCEIELKVRPSSQEAEESCNRFLAQFRQWYEPARLQLLAMVRDKESTSEEVREVEKALASLKKANQHYTYVSLHVRRNAR